MTTLTITHNLPFIVVTIYANNQSLVLSNVLLDTGSAATAFKTDDLAKLGLELELGDTIKQMFGVGGSEYVIEKQVSKIQVGNLVAEPFTVQMGALDYGFPMGGILGMDFLLKVGATIDFRNLEIRST